MKIHLADHYGLCFGVRDALAAAERLAATAPLTILGELVHNPIVRERLERLGVHERKLGSALTAPTRQVMITAHGASEEERNRWRRAGYGVADGSCPLVRHAHAQLKMLVDHDFFPVVIGQRGHVEVEGLIGDFPGATVIESETEAATLPEQPRYGVISQTTQPIGRVRTIVQAIRNAWPKSDVRFVDTVCKPTKDRQQALQRLLEQCDTVVVVGGRNSNNTRQLVVTAERAGRRTFHIERAEELEPAWFGQTRAVGITAGTSTLKETVAAVHERLQQIAARIAPTLGAPEKIRP